MCRPDPPSFVFGLLARMCKHCATCICAWCVCIVCAREATAMRRQILWGGIDAALWQNMQCGQVTFVRSGCEWESLKADQCSGLHRFPSAVPAKDGVAALPYQHSSLHNIACQSCSLTLSSGLVPTTATARVARLRICRVQRTRATTVLKGSLIRQASCVQEVGMMCLKPLCPSDFAIFVLKASCLGLAQASKSFMKHPMCPCSCSAYCCMHSLMSKICSCTQAGYYCLGGDALKEPCTAPQGRFCAQESSSPDGDTDCEVSADHCNNTTGVGHPSRSPPRVCLL